MSAARLLETLFGLQIVLSMHQEIAKENSLGARVDFFLILNTAINRKMQKTLYKSTIKKFSSFSNLEF